jgi:hypothetical protein
MRKRPAMIDNRLEALRSLGAKNPPPTQRPATSAAKKSDLPRYVAFGSNLRAGAIHCDMFGVWHASCWSGALGAFDTSAEAEEAIRRAPARAAEAARLKGAAPMPESRRRRVRPCPSGGCADDQPVHAGAQPDAGRAFVRAADLGQPRRSRRDGQVARRPRRSRDLRHVLINIKSTSEHRSPK